MSERDELYRQITRLEKQFEKNKFRRMILTICGIAVVFLIMFFISNVINNVKDFVIGIIASVVGAWIYFYVNLLIFTPLFSISQSENERLETLKRKYNELNK